jgi:hypothetical protein
MLTDCSLLYKHHFFGNQCAAAYQPHTVNTNAVRKCIKRNRKGSGTVRWLVNKCCDLPPKDIIDGDENRRLCRHFECEVSAGIDRIWKIGEKIELFGVAAIIPDHCTYGNGLIFCRIGWICFNGLRKCTDRKNQR